MKILFIAQGCLPFHNRSIEERPLGGIETGIIRLAQELSNLGQDVIVATTIQNPPLSSPLYIPLNAVNDVGEVDILVSVRDWQPLLLPLPAKRHFFWTGDSYDQPQTLGIGDPRIIAKCNALLCVSDWHADELSRRSGFPRERCWTIRNGVHLPYFDGSELRHRHRLIYSSTPYRGLEFLPKIFSEIKLKVPDAELHIFSDFTVYAGAGEYPNHVVEHYKQVRILLSQMPGVVFHGNIKQGELAREFMRSAILAYPNIFEETSCITALEAQAAGCVTVSTQLGALPETVSDSGILISPPVNSEAYRSQFVSACVELLTNDKLWSEFSGRSLARKTSLGWAHVAKRFLQFLEQQD